MYKRYIQTAIFILSTLLFVTPSIANASTNITISQNGKNSTNTVITNNSSVFTSFQSNVSNIINSVFSNANTGGNKIKGNGSITTGNATSNVIIHNNVNSNIIDVPEFSPLQALLISIISITGFLFLRKRFA